MPAYLISDAHITDQAAYEKYKQQVVPLITRLGGKFIVRGGATEVLEGSWKPARLVIIEFPDMKALKSWYDSPEYAPIRALRLPAAAEHLVAVEGY